MAANRKSLGKKDKTEENMDRSKRMWIRPKRIMEKTGKKECENIEWKSKIAFLLIHRRNLTSYW